VQTLCQPSTSCSLNDCTDLVDIRLLVFPSPSRQASLFMPRSIRPALRYDALQNRVVKQAWDRDVLVWCRRLVLFSEVGNSRVCRKTDRWTCSKTGARLAVQTRFFGCRRRRRGSSSGCGRHDVDKVDAICL
jgi:hypothetical protein